MSRQEMLAQSVEMSRVLLARYFKRFDDSNHTKQAPGLPNHFAWTLGHVSLLLHRAAQQFEGPAAGPIPEADFVTGNGRGGDRRRFDTEGVAFGSTPLQDAALYPTASRCLEILDAAVARLARAIRATDDVRLDSSIKWFTGETTLWHLAVRMIFHNGTHCGQLADLRRALGLGSILA
jgi:hypothetical protein